MLSSLTKIKSPVLSDLLVLNAIFQKHKVNEMINKFLLTGDKFMPEMHLKQLGLAYRECGRFTKNKKRIKKI